MTLKDLLRRKDRIQHDNQPENGASVPAASMPEFTFLRTDTNTQEIIEPPSPPSEKLVHGRRASSNNANNPSRFRSSSHASTSSTEPKAERRLSSLLGLRSHSRSSINVPTDLPSIAAGTEGDEEQEAQWEQRATILAKENPNLKHGVPLTEELPAATAKWSLSSGASNDSKPVIRRSISDAQGDV